MKVIYDPADLTKCYFRGLKYIADKHTNETLLQYNVKHSGDYPPTTQDNDKPPQKAFIPDPKVNSEENKCHNQLLIQPDLIQFRISSPGLMPIQMNNNYTLQ